VSEPAFRSIGEAAEAVGVAPHVLRFWEEQFSAVKPVKRAGGRRYYRPDDIRLLQAIRHLLHDEGRTIDGVRRLFGRGASGVLAAAGMASKPAGWRAELEAARDELRAALARPRA